MLSRVSAARWSLAAGFRASTTAAAVAVAGARPATAAVACFSVQRFQAPRQSWQLVQFRQQSWNRPQPQPIRSFAVRTPPPKRLLTRYENMLVDTEIRGPVVRIKSEEKGVPLRELSLAAALQEAKVQNLQLVCVLLKTNPPICTIEDAAKVNFELNKKAKQLQKVQREKATPVKGMRFKGRIHEADMKLKLSQVVKFMEKGYDVGVEIQKAVSEQQLHYVYNRCVVAMYEIGAPTVPFNPNLKSYVFKRGGKHLLPLEHYQALTGDLHTASQKAIEAQDAATAQARLARKLARRKVIANRRGHDLKAEDGDPSEDDDDMSDR